jgi:hypothetical protein
VNRQQLGKLFRSVSLQDKSANFVPAIVFCLGLYTCAATIAMVVRCWDPIPVMDQWDSLVSNRIVTWPWLFAQFNEHRILFPRLIFWLDRWLTAETNRVNFAANIVSQSALTALIVMLARGLFARTGLTALWITGLALTFLFSAAQYENFDWGNQIQFFGVLSAATATFGLVAANRRSLAFTIAAVAVEFVAVYTLSSGILVPPLALCLAIWIKRPRLQLAVLAIAAAALPALYLVGYHMPPSHADPTQAGTSLVLVPVYFFAYLGGPLAMCLQQANAALAACIGAAVLVAFIVTAWTAARTIPARQEAALIIIGVFLVGGAAATAVGRVHFGPEQALASRYATPVLLFWLVTLVLCAGRLRSHPAASRAMLMTTLALSALLAWREPRFVKQGEFWTAQHLLAKPALLADVADPNLRRIYPDPAVPLQIRGVLLQAHTSVFAEGWSRLLGASFTQHFAVSHDAACRGTYLRAIPLDPARTAWRASGTAWMDPGKTILYRIILADRADRIVGYGWGGFKAEQIGIFDQASNGPREGWWTGDFTSANPADLAAFALEPDGHSACPLPRATDFERVVNVATSHPLP